MRQAQPKNAATSQDATTGPLAELAYSAGLEQGSLPVWTPVSRCAMSRRPPPTPTRAPPFGMSGTHLTGPACHLHRRRLPGRSRPIGLRELASIRLAALRPGGPTTGTTDRDVRSSREPPICTPATARALGQGGAQIGLLRGPDEGDLRSPACAGPGAYICNERAGLYDEIIEKERARPDNPDRDPPSRSCPVLPR